MSEPTSRSSGRLAFTLASAAVDVALQGAVTTPVESEQAKQAELWARAAPSNPRAGSRTSQTVVAGGKSKDQNTASSGVVVFIAKSTFTIAEMEQMSRYVNTANAARAMGRLSPTGKISTSGALRAEASRAANQERKRAERDGAPYQGQVGHAPDTTWTGRPGSDEWHDQTPNVNQSLGGQSRGYPAGFIPTDFALGYTWESE